MTDKERAAWDKIAVALSWQKMDSKDWRKEQHNVINNAIEAIDALLEDDEPPRIDRSLRGWVMVEMKNNIRRITWATKNGLNGKTNEDGLGLGQSTAWDAAEQYGWTVRPLTPEDIGFKVRRYGEWTPAERDEYGAFVGTGKARGDCIDLALDIATRRTP